MRNFFSKVGFGLFVFGLAMTVHAQSMIAGGPNVYSPHFQNIAQILYMYFGGWNDIGQTNDKIYRSLCVTPSKCELQQSVVFLQDDGTYTDRPAGTTHINDPSIVNLGDHLVMYFTVCPDGVEGEKCVSDTSVNSVFSATSPANDGLRWSKPKLVTANAWMPSAVVRPNGDVWLYANSATDCQLFFANLGPQGNGNAYRTNITFPSYQIYVNAEIRYNPEMHLYQMLGEGGGSVDYLESPDGMNFKVVIPSILHPVGEWTYIRTPAFIPGSNREISAAATKDNTCATGGGDPLKACAEGNKIWEETLF